jgi:hypothetical protein
MKKIELTPEQKYYIELSLSCKTFSYIAEETGLSIYKIRQYAKEYLAKQETKLKNGDLE